MSACVGLTQGDLELEYITPFLSSLSFSIIFFFPIDVRLTCVCVVMGTTSEKLQKYHMSRRNSGDFGCILMSAAPR